MQYVVVEKQQNNNNNNSTLQVSTASMNTGRLPHVDNKNQQPANNNNQTTIKPTIGKFLTYWTK